jgi:hypothetical protein
MKKIIAFAVVGVIFVVLLLSCFTSVPAGFTGVPVTFGRVADYTCHDGYRATYRDAQKRTAGERTTQ